MEKACEFIIDWIKKMELKGLKGLEMKKEEGRTAFVLG
jgi:transposase